MKPFFRKLPWPALAVAVILACSAKPPVGDGDDNAGDDSDDTSDDLGTGTGGTAPPIDDDGGFIPPDDSPPDANCGDSQRAENEACDDGNQNSGDGCANNCRYVEPGYICREAGTPCTRFAVCGDGVSGFPEQCDDGGTADGDGCSAVCKFEIGFTCDGSPSVCRATVCGDGKQEGSETCEAADGMPFDGCSVICQGEPSCSDNGCTSSCGDGLIIGDEECDDGNGVDFDGCSADCKQEPGYTCTSAPPCEGDACTLNLPIIFRDFDLTHPDFFPPYKDGDMDGHAPGIVEDRLNADGKPVYKASPPLSHVESAASFGQWYTASDRAIVKTITLYPNGKGGYVNRFGPNGEQYLASVKTPNEQTGGNTLAACEASCRQRAVDSQPPFTGQPNLRCDDRYREDAQPAQQLRDSQLNQLQNQLAQEEAKATPDEDVIAELEADIADMQAQIDAILAEADANRTDCETQLDERTAVCAAQCLPCSFNPDQFCIGGEQLALDGNPLFFPIDDAPNPDFGKAKIPAQIYQGIGWPWEGGTEAASPNHNFHFTSEIAYWFEYEEGMTASFEFIGDDDVFVFVNRRLLIDLGGIHVPLIGQFDFAANGNVTYRTWTPPDPGEGETANTPIANGMTTVADLGLTPGGVYEIKVFHAERKPEGSSFQLTLSGFDTSRSVCLPMCGDGIIAAGEQCDDGTEGNVGGFNRCNANCTLGAFCGDGIVQSPEEECDDADPNKPADCNGCKILIFE
jgi:fibro-slime domain-containing protein